MYWERDEDCCAVGWSGAVVTRISQLDEPGKKKAADAVASAAFMCFNAYQPEHQT